MKIGWLKVDSWWTPPYINRERKLRVNACIKWLRRKLPPQIMSEPRKGQVLLLKHTLGGRRRWLMIFYSLTWKQTQVIAKYFNVGAVKPQFPVIIRFSLVFYIRFKHLITFLIKVFCTGSKYNVLTMLCIYESYSTHIEDQRHYIIYITLANIRALYKYSVNSMYK